MRAAFSVLLLVALETIIVCEAKYTLAHSPTPTWLYLHSSMCYCSMLFVSSLFYKSERSTTSSNRSIYLFILPFPSIRSPSQLRLFFFLHRFPSAIHIHLLVFSLSVSLQFSWLLCCAQLAFVLMLNLILPHRLAPVPIHHPNDIAHNSLSFYILISR